ncbi:MAG: VOC family protein [Pseudorhodobacter sp.]|nr:VOC family protein [Pseudorhodobacter sp.]
MIDHMGIRTANYAQARPFYDAVFAALGGGMRHEVPLQFTGGKHVGGFGRDAATFWLNEAATASEAQHVAFSARNRAEVDAFYAAAMAAGGRDNGGPGLRPQYHADYYAAFVFDPDGNNIEAVCHKPE